MFRGLGEASPVRKIGAGFIFVFEIYICFREILEKQYVCIQCVYVTFHAVTCAVPFLQAPSFPTGRGQHTAPARSPAPTLSSRSFPTPTTCSFQHIVVMTDSVHSADAASAGLCHCYWLTKGSFRWKLLICSLMSFCEPH